MTLWWSRWVSWDGLARVFGGSGELQSLGEVEWSRYGSCATSGLFFCLSFWNFVQIKVCRRIPRPLRTALAAAPALVLGLLLGSYSYH